MSIGIGLGYMGGGGTAAPVTYTIFVLQKFRKDTYASAERIRMQEQPRNYIIVRNLSDYTAEIAYTTVGNNNSNRPTTGFTQIPAGQEYYEQGTYDQLWYRPATDGQEVLIEVETSVSYTPA